MPDAPKMKPPCPRCHNHVRGECEPCRLFLCDWCERWVSWDDGGGGDAIDDGLCCDCWVRRRGFAVVQPLPHVAVEADHD